jgi:restriction endonuclease S subunit
VNIKDMTSTSGMYITETAQTITDAGIENSSVKLVRKGTVLLSFKLSPGKTAIAGANLYTNEAIAALVPRDGRVLAEYLYYLLPRLDYSQYARKATKGKTLNKKSVASIKIPVPSIAVQKKIIGALAAQEKIIADHKKKIGLVQRKEDELIAKMSGVRRPQK